MKFRMYGDPPNLFDRIEKRVEDMWFIDSVVFDKLTLNDLRLTDLFLVSEIFFKELI